MCNPRRIRVTATRLLNEAWQREVSRMVQLQERVIGEARVRQTLGVTMGEPALRALEAILGAENSGWTEVPQGYRYDVEGGYVIYLIDEQALEIVAVLEDEVQASGEAHRLLEGQSNTELSAEGESRYYDDGYGGRTQETAERDAQAEAERRLAEAAEAHLRQMADAAEEATAADMEAEALRRAREQLQREAAAQQARLAEQARQHLQTVGLRARQAFHRAMAQAYREALLAYARQRGAEHVQISESEDVVEIEFNFTG